MDDLNTTLGESLADLLYLLERGYSRKPAVELVGNRYGLAGEDRSTLYRGVFPLGLCAARKKKRAAALPGRLLIDGYNVLITLESYLKGKRVFFCLDGFLRDVSGVFGSYRIDEMTRRSVDLLAGFLRDWSASSPRADVLLLLDAPVSRSGELAGYLREHAGAVGIPLAVEVSRDPDARIVSESGGCGVATSDGVVIDRVDTCVDIPARVIGELPGGGNVPSLENLLHATGG
jgi:hypothetical protein